LQRLERSLSLEFRSFAFGDIGVRAEHQQRLAVSGAGDDATAVLNPNPVAVLVLNPAVKVVIWQLACEVALEKFAGLLQVIGMGIFLPCLDANGFQLI